MSWMSKLIKDRKEEEDLNNICHNEVRNLLLRANPEKYIFNFKLHLAFFGPKSQSRSRIIPSKFVFSMGLMEPSIRVGMTQKDISC